VFGKPIDVVALAHSEIAVNILMNYHNLFTAPGHIDEEDYKVQLTEIQEAISTLAYDLDKHRTTSDYRCIYEAR